MRVKREGKMFNSITKFQGDQYKLDLPIDTSWSKAKARLMIIIEHISTADLKAHKLLSDGDTRAPVVNVINYARRYAAKLGKAVDPAYMVINYRAEKHLHLSTEQRLKKESEFGQRMIEAIDHFKPTHVLICGHRAYRNIVQCGYPAYHLGWVESLKIGKTQCKVTQTFDFFQLLENKGKYANHLRMVAYHLAYLLLGVHPFSLANVQSKPQYVNTRERFDSMMQLLKSSKMVAMDSETKDLSVLANAIYTIQFASDKSDTGYVLPLNHPQTPFSAEDIHYFKSEIRKFLGAKDGPILVTMNGKFDLRVLRRVLKLPIIRRKVWEITAGEHLLNEEMVDWTTLMGGNSFGGLRAILCTYQNDFYFKNEFTKEDRGTTGEVKPDDPAFLRYCAMDVCCLIPMVKMQIKRASYEDLCGKSYKPYFIRHMLCVMSDTEHVLSSLDECGSKIDIEYMKLLQSKDSPFLIEANKVKQEIYDQPETVKANAELLKEAGYKSKGLFGSNSIKDSWIFNIGRPEHRLKLFLDVMGLDSVETTPNGAPSIGKIFVNAYKYANYTVSLYSKYQELNKIITAYIKSWYRKILDSVDGAIDYHLRPGYGFWGVATGRISSFNPSLQVIPQHSDSAQILKSLFIAPEGKLLVHYDYSAHEVRGWSIAAGDMVLGDAFREGQTLRKQWIACEKIPEKDKQLQALFNEYLIYDKDTGKFFSKKDTKLYKKGMEVHLNEHHGAYYLNLKGTTYSAHRVAFCMVYGYLPEEVDHIDNNGLNNKISNLRPATQQENSRNRRADSTRTSSKYKGVYPAMSGKRWIAQIKPSVNEKVKHLGTFDTQEEAHEAYVKAAKKYFGNFANDGENSLAKKGDYRHPSVILREKMAKHADIHIQNVYRFFGKWVTKKDPLRQAVKSTIFGLLYGKGTSTLGEDTKSGELQVKQKEVSQAYNAWREASEKDKPKLEKALNKAKDALQALKDEDRTDYAQHIVDKTFTTFKKGKIWTDHMKYQAEKLGYVYSPLGRIRHLASAVLVNKNDKRLINRQIRRGSNAPIQGFASELAVKATRLTHETYYDELPVLMKMLGLKGKQWDYQIETTRQVHDASYYAVPYVMVLPFIQITQYQATYGIARLTEKQFNMKFTVEPEVEFETGISDAGNGLSATWDYDIANLLQNIKQNLIAGHEKGLIADVNSVYKEILRPWLNKDVVKYLDEKYPLLDVHLAKKIYQCAKHEFDTLS
jgi:DNA polymerase I-like protein with 3'-5' exonuclease and polymerase domains